MRKICKLLIVLTIALSFGVVVHASSGTVKQSISIKKTTFNVGDKDKPLGATAKTKMTFKSSDSSILSVNKKGNITAKKSGSVKMTISAKASGKYNAVKKTFTIKVNKKKQTITANNKSINHDATNIGLGAKAKTSLTYKSSNNKVVSVNSKGQITATSVGAAKITIVAKATKTYKSATKTINVRVTSKFNSYNVQLKRGTKNVQYLTQSKMETEMLKYINEYRMANGLGALNLRNDLNNSARIRACESSVSFSHTRPNGLSCFSVFPSWMDGYGENLASGFSTSKNAFDGWVRSPGHKDNMLNKHWKYIGISIITVDNRIYYVTAFGMNW